MANNTPHSCSLPAGAAVHMFAAARVVRTPFLHVYVLETAGLEVTAL